MFNIKSIFDQKSNIIILNYLLMVYAFFAPISGKTSFYILLLLSLLLLFSEGFINRFMSIIQDKVVQGFVLFYSMHLIWMVGSDDINMALFKLNDYKFILTIVIIAMTIEKEFINKILTSFMLGMYINELFSYAMALHIKIPMIKLTAEMGNVPFMQSYTEYATVLSIVLGIIFYKLLSNKNSSLQERIFYILFFITASANIFIVASRIGYVLYTLSILSVLLFFYKKQLIKILIAGSIPIILAYTLAYNFSELFKLRISALYYDIVSIPDKNFTTSIGTRAGFYLYDTAVIKNNFFFGVGAGDHITEVKKIILSKEPNQANIDELFFNLRNGYNASLHSEFLDNITQFGIVGLIIYINMFYQLLIYKQNDTNRKILQIILSVTLLFLSIGSNVFNPDFLARILILLSALSLTTFGERQMFSKNKSISYGLK